MLVTTFPRWCVRLLTMAFFVPALAWAHDYKLGQLRMDHPYALIKTEPSIRVEVYFRSLRNEGDQLDRLVAMRTPVATKAVVMTETHSVDHDITWVPVQSLEIPAKGQVAMRHGKPEGYQILLTELTRPLKVGDRFPLYLLFDKSGEKEVMVWVQAPRNVQPSHKH